ncbi:MAG: hypothetical protein QOC70_2386 [Verrucomicrobiota bacterium]|jgi:hypothetical protein
MQAAPSACSVDRLNGYNSCQPAQSVFSILPARRSTAKEENSPVRALKWAEFLRDRPIPGTSKVKNPFVVGAVISPGNCLDLSEALLEAILFFGMTAEVLPFVEQAHRLPRGFAFSAFSLMNAVAARPFQTI